MRTWKNDPDWGSVAVILGIIMFAWIMSKL